MSLEKTVDKHQEYLEKLAVQLNELDKKVYAININLQNMNEKLGELTTNVINRLEKVEFDVKELKKRFFKEEIKAEQRKSLFNLATNGGFWRLIGIIGGLLAVMIGGGWGADKIYHKASPDQQKYIQSLERQNQALEAQVKKPTN